MPNQAIVIMTDSQRYDMVGCYKYPQMHTPCLDAFSETALRFEKAYTTQPVCGPARSAIFTGLYPHSNGSWTNSVALYENVKTVAQRLSPMGVHCAFIGKWHLDGSDYFGLGRCPDGWDEEYWY
ncbi:MAG: sulfatase-like hydrolase/transferase, partial [Clostridia bacterium]|nr:sulfatase-like hydrolase/transferase [Clostridia bacterium]